MGNSREISLTALHNTPHLTSLALGQNAKVESVTKHQSKRSQNEIVPKRGTVYPPA